MNGMPEGGFSPQAGATRAQAAKVAYLICDMRGAAPPIPPTPVPEPAGTDGSGSDAPQPEPPADSGTPADDPTYVDPSPVH
jgi:hypothetical protein